MSERRLRWTVFVWLAVLLTCALGLALIVGSVRLDPLALMKTCGLPIAHVPLDAMGEAIFWTVRLPRVLLAILVGGGLAIVGAALQAIFRNPMADAGLLGVGPGAALGSVLAIQMGFAAQLYFALPLAAFTGAMLTVLLVYLCAHLRGRPTLSGLLLTGLAISALTSAGTTMALVATDEYRVKTVLFWLSGGLEGRSWSHVQATALVLIPATIALFSLARALDVLSLGEEAAASLGVRVHALRFGLLALSALIAGTVTAAAGAIPFIGLMAAHALRPWVGARGRHLLPATFLGGALLLVLADTAARTFSARVDLPLGAVTAVIGTPYFLLALSRQEGRA
jgi:iron complex transport system permease protein